MDMAIEYRDKGVVGVDVAGDELQPMAPHVDAFKVTVHNNIVPVTACISCFAGQLSVKEKELIQNQ